MPNLVGYIEIMYSNVIFVGNNTLKPSGVIVHHVSNLFPNDSIKILGKASLVAQLAKNLPAMQENWV